MILQELSVRKVQQFLRRARERIYDIFFISGSIRGLLGVHLTDIIEIADYDFKDYTVSVINNNNNNYYYYYYLSYILRVRPGIGY